jgi:hypothetical protein
VVVRQTRGGRRWLQLWHPEYLPRQVDPQKLDQLVAAQQAVVIAQHLGADIGKVQFPLATVDALRILKAYEDDGQVLVASTGRLLRFEQVREHLRLDLFERGAEIVIDMARVVDPLFGEFTPTLEDVRGITLQVDDPGRVELRVGGKRIVEHQLVRSRPTFEEPPSIGVRWFERDVTDYSRSWRR